MKTLVTPTELLLALLLVFAATEAAATPYPQRPEPSEPTQGTIEPGSRHPRATPLEIVRCRLQLSSLMESYEIKGITFDHWMTRVQKVEQDRGPWGVSSISRDVEPEVLDILVRVRGARQLVNTKTFTWRQVAKTCGRLYPSVANLAKSHDSDGQTGSGEVSRPSEGFGYPSDSYDPGGSAGTR
jgi:hypothetical protein